MASVRETALCALQDALEAVAGRKVAARNSHIPEVITGEGLLVLRDGDPGEPEIDLGVIRYYYEHEALIDCVVQASSQATLNKQLDELLQDISTAIAADDTLAGTVDKALVGAPIDEEDTVWEGAEDLRGVIVPITLIYSTTNPLT